MDIPQTNKASYIPKKENEIVGSYIMHGLQMSGGIGVSQVRTIFLLALKDYYEDKIHLYTLASIAEEIYDHINGIAFGTGDIELDRLFSDLSDIDIYYKERDENNKYEETLSALNQYWDANKQGLIV